MPLIVFMQNKIYNTTFKIILGISVVLYLVSLTQEGFCTVNRCGDNWTGFAIVGFGAIGGILSMTGMVWYANPALWAAWWFLKKKPKQAIYFSAAATVISLSFMFCTEIADQQPGRQSYITAYRAGYWLWIASIICVLFGSLILFLWRRKIGPEEERYYPF